MNAAFGAWATSTSFSIALTLPQIRALFAARDAISLQGGLLDPMTVFSLERRGLILRKGEAIALTRAGELLADLAREAGLSPRGGLVTPRNNWLRAEQRMAHAIELAKGGMRLGLIAKEIGVNRSTVWRALRRAQTAERPTQ